MIIYGVKYGPEDNQDSFEEIKHLLFVHEKDAAEVAKQLTEEMIESERAARQASQIAEMKLRAEHQALVQARLREQGDRQEQDWMFEDVEDTFQDPWIYRVVEITVQE